MAEDRVAQLLSLLVKHLVPDAAAQPRTLDHAARILGSSIANTPVPADELSVTEALKKRLVWQGQPQSAVALAELVARLRRSRCLRRPWSLLYLLGALAQGGRGDAQQPEGDSSDASLSAASVSLSGLPVKQQPLLPLAQQALQAQQAPLAGSGAPDAQPLPLPLVEEGGSAKGVSGAVPRFACLAYDKSEGPHVSESDVVRDMLYALQGVPSQTLVLSQGPHSHYVLSPTVGAPQRLRDLVARVCEVGWLYGRVCEAIEGAGPGVAQQGLASALQRERAEYLRLVAVLDAARCDSGGSGGSDGPEGLTAHRLLVWLHEAARRMHVLAMVADAARGGLKGGELVTAVHAFARHGDPLVRAVASEATAAAAAPLGAMAARWVCEGVLDDPHDEFYVAADPTVPPERAWRDRYALRGAMLPAYVPPALARRVLVAGKSINFIRQQCGDARWAVDPAVARELALAAGGAGAAYGDTARLARAVDAAAGLAGRHLLGLLLQRFHLMRHAAALRRYLLLGQGDFVQCLMDAVARELSQPAGALYRHSLVPVLEGAVRGSNAQYEDADVLGRLDVCLAEPAARAGLSGWEAFSLTYRVDAPVNAVLTPAVMEAHQRLFAFLWGVRRAGHLLCAAWRRHTWAARALVASGALPADAQAALGAANSVRREMAHLVATLERYVADDVVEPAWQRWAAAVAGAASLDEAAAAQQAYVGRVLEGALLGPGCAELAAAAGALVRACVALCEDHEAFVGACEREAERLEVDGATDEEADEAFALLCRESAARFREAGARYRAMLARFAWGLGQRARDDAGVRSLVLGLDFNGFYASQATAQRPSLPVGDSFIAAPDDDQQQQQQQQQGLPLKQQQQQQ
eukprot:m51a1_g7094 putative gamma tubulin ring complex protein 3 (865) ;mRNA; r:37505-40516